jgi:hypothetical protein
MAKKQKEPESIDDLISDIESNPEDFIQQEVQIDYALLQKDAEQLRNASPEKPVVAPDLDDERQVLASDVLKILLQTPGGLASGCREALIFLGGKDSQLNLTQLKSKYRYNANMHKELLSIYRSSPTHMLSAKTLTVIPKRGKFISNR